SAASPACRPFRVPCSAACGSPASMADKIRVTSVILGSLPRGERLVSLGAGRKLARFGHLDQRAQANVRKLLRPDTPEYALARPEWAVKLLRTVPRASPSFRPFTPRGGCPPAETP